MGVDLSSGAWLYHCFQPDGDWTNRLFLDEQDHETAQAYLAGRDRAERIGALADHPALDPDATFIDRNSVSRCLNDRIFIIKHGRQLRAVCRQCADEQLALAGLD